MSNAKKIILVLTLVFLLVGLGTITAADSSDDGTIKKAQVTKTQSTVKKTTNVEKISKVNTKKKVNNNGDTAKKTSTVTKVNKTTKKVDKTNTTKQYADKTIKNKISKDKKVKNTEGYTTCLELYMPDEVGVGESIPIHGELYEFITYADGELSFNYINDANIDISIYNNTGDGSENVIETTQQTTNYGDFEYTFLITEGLTGEYTVKATYEDLTQEKTFNVQKYGISADCSEKAYINKNYLIEGVLTENGQPLSGSKLNITVYNEIYNEETYEYEPNIIKTDETSTTDDDGKFTYELPITEEMYDVESSNRYYYNLTYEDRSIQRSFYISSNYEMEINANTDDYLYPETTLTVTGLLTYQGVGLSGSEVKLRVYRNDYDYDIDEDVIIYIDDDQITTTTSEDGSFTLEFLIPQNTPSGEYYYEVINENKNYTNWFDIKPSYKISLELEKYEYYTDENITITGYFSHKGVEVSGETLNYEIYYYDSDDEKQVVANGITSETDDGSFSLNYSLSNTNPGSYYCKVYYEDYYDTIDFEVLENYRISLDDISSTVYQGNEYYITGRLTQKGEGIAGSTVTIEVYTKKWDDETSEYVKDETIITKEYTTDDDGSFTFEIPTNMETNEYYYNISSEYTYYEDYFYLREKNSLSVNYIENQYVGDTVIISGTLYEEGEYKTDATVNIEVCTGYYDDENEFHKNVTIYTGQDTTDSYGDFRFEIELNDNIVGFCYYNITYDDIYYSGEFNVLNEYQLTANNEYYGYKNQQYTIDGTLTYKDIGFSDATVTLNVYTQHYDDELEQYVKDEPIIIKECTTDEYGNYVFTFEIPEDWENGWYYYDLTTEYVNVTENGFYVNDKYELIVYINNYNPASGDTLEISGYYSEEGCSTEDVPVTLRILTGYYDENDIFHEGEEIFSQTKNTDEYGRYSFEYEITDSLIGIYYFNVSTEFTSQQEYFEVLSNYEIDYNMNKDEFVKDETLEITGTLKYKGEYLANADINVTIYYVENEKIVIYENTTRTNENGEFTFEYTITKGMYRDYIINLTYDSASVLDSFDVDADIYLDADFSAYSAHAGDVITINGTLTNDGEFAPDTKIFVEVYKTVDDEKQIKYYQELETDAEGKFNYDFTVTEDMIGDYTMKVYYRYTESYSTLTVKNYDIEAYSEYSYNMGEELSVSGTVKKDETPVADAELTMVIYNYVYNEIDDDYTKNIIETLTTTTNQNGQFLFDYVLNDMYGEYYYIITYGEDSVKDYFYVTNNSISLNSNNYTSKANENIEISGELSGQESYDISNKEIILYVNNTEIERTYTDENGAFSFNYQVDSNMLGEYPIKVSFTNVNAEAILIINEETTINLIVPNSVDVNKEFTFNVTLTDGTNPIEVNPNTLEVKVNNQRVEVEYDSANNVYVGKYTAINNNPLEITARFTGEDPYLASTTVRKSIDNINLITTSLTITAPTSIKVSEEFTFTISLKDSQSNIIENQEIVVKINNNPVTVTYNTTTKVYKGKYTATDNTPLKITATYTNNTVYTNSNDEKTISNIKLISTEMYIGLPNEVKVNKEFKFNVTLTDGSMPIESNIIVKVNNNPVTVTYNTTTRLYDGKYTATDNSPLVFIASFNANNVYNASQIEKTLNNIKLQATKLNISAPNSVNVDEEFNFTVKLTDNEDKAIGNQEISIKINDETITGIAKTNSKGEITVKYTPKNNTELKITATYTNNTVYENKNAEQTITDIKLIPTSLELNVPSTSKINEPIAITISLTKADNTIIAGNVILSINGANQTVSITDKTETIQYTPVSGGDLTIFAEYLGDSSKYYGNKTQNSVVKVTIPTSMEITAPESISVQEAFEISVKLNDSTSSINTDVSSITVKVNGKQVNVTYDATKEAYVATYTATDNTALEVTASFAGKDYYDASQAENKIISNINLIPTTLTINVPNTANVSEEISIKIKLTDKDNNSLEGKTVIVKVNGVILTGLKTSDTNGEIIAKYTPKDNTTLEVSAEFSGDKVYSAIKSETKNITVNSKDNDNPETPTKKATKITLSKVSTALSQTVTLTAKITDTNGKKVTGGSVLFKVNGKTIADKTSKAKYINVTNGVAKIQYVVPGNWVKKSPKVQVLYYGNDEYNNSNVTKSGYVNVSKGATKITIKPKTIKTKFGKKITLQIKHIDAISKKGLTSKVSVKINGKTKTVKVTKGSGKLTYTLPRGMMAKTYTITAIHSSKYYNKSIGKSTLKLSKNKVTIKVTKTTTKNKKTKIKAKIKDETKKVLNKNVKVTIKVDGKVVIKNKLVKKGNINLSFKNKLNKGNHKLIISSNANKIYKAGTISTTLKI